MNMSEYSQDDRRSAHYAACYDMESRSLEGSRNLNGLLSTMAVGSIFAARVFRNLFTTVFFPDAGHVDVLSLPHNEVQFGLVGIGVIFAGLAIKSHLNLREFKNNTPPPIK